MQTQLIVLCTALAIAYAATAMKNKKEQDKNIAENEEGCYVKGLGVVISPGESWWTTHGCEKYHCDMKRLIYYTCGVVVANPNCDVLQEKDKLYPNCCPKIKCPAEEKQHEIAN